MARGYQMNFLVATHCGSTSLPAAQPSKNGFVSGLVSTVPTNGIFLWAAIAMTGYSLSRMTVLPTCRVPSEPPVPCAIARSQFFTCTAGCASPRNCRTALDDFRDAATRFAGWLEHNPCRRRC